MRIITSLAIKSADEDSQFVGGTSHFPMVLLVPGRGSEPLGRCPMCGVDAPCAGTAWTTGGHVVSQVVGISQRRKQH